MALSFEFIKLVVENGYMDPKEIANNRVAVVAQLLYHGTMLIMSKVTFQQGWEEKYCYPSVEAARKALADWDGNGEPVGWHRHVPSNRRRHEADPLAEYVHE
jgi:hypothetical protein